MRIISGLVGRRQINVPKSVTRPSTDRLREALFSILADKVIGARVLDLFSGSGALGLEALSRGAASAVMVDESREACRVIGKNLSSLGLEGGRVVQSDVYHFVNQDRFEYDIVFADPPYCKQSGHRDFVFELLDCSGLRSCLNDDAWLVVEDFPKNKRDVIAGWELIDERQYGGCGILFYQMAKSA